MKQPINEIKRMQQLAGLITESQLNEVESSLQTYLTSIEKNLKSKPEELTKKITDYLHSVFVVGNGIPGVISVPNHIYYVIPSKKGDNFITVMGYTDRDKGFIVNDQILKWLVSADPFLSNEAAEKVVQSYIQDSKLNTGGKWGGFEKMGDMLKNQFETNKKPATEPQQESQLNEYDEYDDIDTPEFDDDHDIDAQKKFDDMIVDVPRLHQLISSSHHRGKEVTINGVKVTDVTGIGNIFLENGEKLNSKEFANGVPDIKINNEPINIPFTSSKPPAPLNYKSSDVYPAGSYMDEVVNKALKEHRRQQK